MLTYLILYRGAWGSTCVDTVDAAHPFDAACAFARNHPFRRIVAMRAIGT